MAKRESLVVAAVEKSKGQNLVERMAAWFGSYMSMKPDYAVLCAVWALHTWLIERFDVTPYLCVTAATKGAGKTTLLKLLAAVSQNGEVVADGTAAACFRLIAEFDGRIMFAFDEAEKFFKGGFGVERSILNNGYEAGGTVPRTGPGGKVFRASCFCAKAFGLIGDVNPTLRDRSIVLTLVAGRPGRDMVRPVMMAEAAAFKAEIVGKAWELFKAPAAVLVDWLPTERDRQIWGTIFGMAASLGLDAAMVEGLERTAAGLAAGKSAPRRRAVDLEEAEQAGVMASFGPKALRDLGRVIGSAKHMPTAVCVAGLLSDPRGGWGMFRGVGLDAVGLSGLLSPFGVGPKSIRVGDKVLQGYKRAEVLAAIEMHLDGGGR